MRQAGLDFDVFVSTVADAMCVRDRASLPGSRKASVQRGGAEGEGMAGGTLREHDVAAILNRMSQGETQP